MAASVGGEVALAAALRAGDMAVPGGAEVITPALAAPLLAAVLQTESRGIAVTHDRALAMAKRAFVPRLVCRQQPLRRATTSLSQHFHLQGCHLRFKSCSTIATIPIKINTANIVFRCCRPAPDGVMFSLLMKHRHKKRGAAPVARSTM